MRRLLYIITTLIILLTSTSIAVEGDGTPGAHLRLGFGARELAMGGAGTAISSGPLALYWNPALTPIEERVSFESSMETLSMDRYLYYALASVNIKGATLSGGIISANTKHIEERDANGQKTGEFDYPQNIFCLAFTPAFSQYFNIGIGFRKHSYNLYGISGSGISLDVGFSTRPVESLSFGFFFGDVWSSLQWDSLGSFSYGRDEKFPLTFRMGVGFYSFDERLVISGDIWKTSGDDTTYHLGVEGWIFPNLALRGGVNHDRLNYGLGFKYPLGEASFFTFDYAYIQDQFNISDGHIVSLGLEL